MLSIGAEDKFSGANRHKRKFVRLFAKKNRNK